VDVKKATEYIKETMPTIAALAIYLNASGEQLAWV
jgi:hypothetical protein